MMKVLIADDDADSLKMLETLLKGRGYHVFTAVNGKDALERLDREVVDLIISDILMPKMDGFQLCRAVKSDDALKRIPFIFYTATYTSEKDRDFALRLGASRFILKPTDPDEFISIMHGVVAESERGQIPPGAVSLEQETEYLKEHQARLLKKQEDQLARLQEANQVLEREIEQRKQLEKDLLHSAEKWYATFDALRDSVCLMDMEGRVLQCNSATTTVIGKPFSGIINGTCCELVHGASEPIKGCPFVRMKETLRREHLEFSAHGKWLHEAIDPVLDMNGSLIGAVQIISDITDRKRAEEEREKLIHELKDTLASVKQLSGMLPICASCKKIRDDEGYWRQIEAYITNHSEAIFTHGLCPECATKAFIDLDDFRNRHGK